MEDHFGKFRISDALQSLYKLIWDDFCSQYLELIKPIQYTEKDANGAASGIIDEVTYLATIDFFERLMAMAHPFMPFITEEIWQDIRPRQPGSSLCVAPYPVPGSVDKQLLADFETLFEIITTIRNVRNARQIGPKVPLPLAIRSRTPARFGPLEGLIQKMANVPAVQYVAEKPESATSFLIKADEFYLDLAGEIDPEQERVTAERDLAYQQGFLDSVLKKLGNERFMANANPDVVARERQKAADAEAKLAALKETLRRLRP